MSPYGRGWKRSPADAPKRFGAGVRFAAGDLPSSHMLSLPDGFPLDQTTSQGCVAHWIAASVRILTGQPLPSRRFAYDIARIEDGEDPRALTDDGCQPSSMVAALGRRGLCLETDLPWDAAAVNEPLSWNALRIASAYQITGFERLPDGAARIDAVRRAIVAGHPVGFGGPVDDAYEQLSSAATYPGITGPVLGLHMQTIVGFDGSRFRVLNSWGRAWGDGGFAWVDQAHMLNPQCSDFYALDAAPAGMT